jgi:glyoxylase-like metal-dependent hydrolase (beta-lactamase superfamily II)
MNYLKSLSIYFNQDKVRIIHFPYGAHTSGDSIVWFVKAGVIAAGDLFYSKTFPWIDFEHGGDAIGMANALHDLIALVPMETKIISGHGTFATGKELKLFYNMIVETLIYVKQKMDQHITLQDIKNIGLPAQYKHWDDGVYVPETLWIEFLYKSWEMGKTALIDIH